MDLTFNCKIGSLIWGFPAHIHLASIYTYLIIGGGSIQIYRLRNVSVGISVSPRVCFILDLILISMFLR